MSLVPESASKNISIASPESSKAAPESVMWNDKSANEQPHKPEQQQQQQGNGTQSRGDEKPKKRNSLKGKRKTKPGKIHIRLPSIEAYQKDLCFAAEAPGRVVVRLERLMGSDKIRPVDGKFMETLIQRLEEEERIAWNRRIRLRKKAEKERYRQLAISGLMEPGPGMEDLYNHPVFRVNRILNRLTSLDSNFSHNRSLKLPPIVQIEPFEKDKNGGFFKEYPTHRALRNEWESYKTKQSEKKEEEETITLVNVKSYADLMAQAAAQRKSRQSQRLAVPKSSKADASSKASISKVSKSASLKEPATGFPKKSARESATPAVRLTSPSDMEEEDEYDEELLEEELLAAQSGTQAKKVEQTDTEMSEIEQIGRDLNREYMESLIALQEKYNVPQHPGFENEWKPFHNKLLEKLFEEFHSAQNIYDAARDLFDMYTRQALMTKDHVTATTGKFSSSQKSKNAKHTRISGKVNKQSIPSVLVGTHEEPTNNEDKEHSPDEFPADETDTEKEMIQDNEEILDAAEEADQEEEAAIPEE